MQGFIISKGKGQVCIRQWRHMGERRYSCIRD